MSMWRRLSAMFGSSPARPSAPPSPDPGAARSSSATFESPTEEGLRQAQRRRTALSEELDTLRRLNFDGDTPKQRQEKRGSKIVSERSKLYTVLEARRLGWDEESRATNGLPAEAAGIRVAYNRGYPQAFDGSKISLWARQISDDNAAPLPRGRPTSVIDLIGKDRFIDTFRQSQDHCFHLTDEQVADGCWGQNQH